jgi:hypothetical protein
MDFLRRNSSLGPILPIIAPFTATPGTQSPVRQDSGAAADGSAQNHTYTNAQGHRRKWSSLFRSLEQIDTEKANEHGHRRSNSGGLIMSPMSDGTVCVEPEDGTFDEVIGRRMGLEKQGTDATMINDSAQQEEKPGDGNVWDVWAVMPKNVRRWNKPARFVPCQSAYAYKRTTHVLHPLKMPGLRLRNADRRFSTAYRYRM